MTYAQRCVPLQRVVEYWPDESLGEAWPAVTTYSLRTGGQPR